jgi:hypothetical protein
MLGDHSVLVGELESWVSREPLRERFWGQLIVALYRAGRQADAVRAYQRARDVLVEQLGLEPGVDLRRLEAAVLARDSALDAPEAMHGASSDLAIPLPGRVAAALSRVFVGRAHEREGLNRSLKSVETGERRMVFISGEPGIGKTALSAAFARDAFESDAIVLYGRCDEDLGIPYQPWNEVLAFLVEHLPNDLIAAHVEARGSVLARLAPELIRGAPAAQRSPDDPESERFLLFGAVVDVLARVSALAPTVLVLDDLHWGDSPTIQLLRYVASADAPLRMLVIATFRDSDLGADHPLTEALAALHRESGVERVALRGLGDDELLTLLEATAGHSMADEGVALRDALMDETDGNPFFVGEMLRHLAESGLVYQDERGRLVPSSDLRTSGLPVSIREVIGRRVARLGVQTQGALTRAAVIGRDFDVDLLSAVAELGEDTLVDLCDEAVTAELLMEADVAGRYSFRHALIEHVLYDDLSAGRRSRAHRAVAEALEEMCGDDPAERTGELAYHWARATEPQITGKAISYAQRAGDRALAQLAPDEARRWYSDALDLLDRAGTDDPRRRAALMLGLGDAQRQTGDPSHRETLLAAGRLADAVDAVDILVRAALRNNRGWNSMVGAVDRERVDMVTRALERLGNADSPDRARLLALLCVEVIWDVGFEERLSMATEAVEIARRTGDNAALVDAIRLSHESITMPHTLELRRSWNAEACELADRLGDPIARLHANDWRFSSALEAGDLATVKAASVIFESESERIGQPVNRWQIAYHRVCQRTLEGDLDVAEQLATDALTLGTAAGHPDDALTIYGGQLVTLRWMQGRIHEIVSLAEQAVSDNPMLRIFRATLAFAKSLDGARDEAAHVLDVEVAQDFPALPDPTWLVAEVLWAGAAASARHRPASVILYQRLLPWHAQFATTQTTGNGGVAHYLGLLAHALDRYEQADWWFRDALALHEAMEAPFFVALTQTAWADLLVQRDQLGDRDRARPLLEAALSAAVERGFGAVERDARSVLARVSA